MLTEDVTSDGTGKRLDSYLQERLPQFSRSRLQSWIKSGNIRVNGMSAKASYLLRGTEHITIEPARLPPLQAEPENLPLKIVYEDADVVVVDKPADMVVHAGAGNNSGTLVNALLHHFGSLSSAGGDLRPGIVHRIDRDTSGLLVVARTDQAHLSLARQFHDRTVQKIYIALVHGHMPRQEGTIDARITRDPVRRTRMTCKLGTGREALTHYQVIEEFDRFSLLQVRIATGRTHQIRVHLASIRHPIYGDRLYGAPSTVADLPVLKRFFLHAAKLQFHSPSMGQPLAFESPLPQELTSVLGHLRIKQLE